MKIVHEFPHKVREIEHVDVPMPDGCRLAARIWMPEGAETAPVPAILEYIPYRKNDLTARRDAMTHPYIAGHGYAVVRLDLRGAGDSEGLLTDEYLPQELQDGADAIAWIADQPWCDGNVGMIGISWGGFNGLQIAALRPPALKAVITLCSTDDRYEDDVHYMGGCMLIDNFSWASVMFGRNTLPPDPRIRGDAWRDMWMDRLKNSGLWLKNWLEHQTRDDFWKHGSVCEDYAKIAVPVYAVSGWADGYCRAVFRLMEKLPGPRKGLIGPWAHTYPHIGRPGPAIGFLQESLRWWDHWLKGRDTGIMAEPMLRLYMQDPAAPRGAYEARPGRWVAEPSWPSPNVARIPYALGSDGRLVREGRDLPSAPRAIRSPLTVGMAAGKWCSYAQPGDQPVDQRVEDGGSLCFETAPLAEALEIAGDANLDLTFAVDRPVAMVAVRLMDVAPDGAETRVCYGVFNLTHRTGHSAPEALMPGERYTVRVPFKPAAQRFEAGHRIRLAISTCYFPIAWPAPEPVTMTVYPGETMLELPIRTPCADDDRLSDFAAPEAAPGLAVEELEPAERHWRVNQDHATGRTVMEVAAGDGLFRLVDIDLTIKKQGRERYGVVGDDLASVTAEASWELSMQRGDWRVRSLTETTLTADPRHFHIHARLRAWEGDALVHERVWSERLPRRLV
jgi:hypothetical protein